MIGGCADKIASHPLSEDLLSDIEPFANRVAEAIEEDIAKRKLLHLDFSLNETRVEGYIFRACRTTSQLVSAFEHLDQAMQLLTGEVSSETIGMTKDEWRSYHYYTYQRAYVVINDLSLILTNEILNLGIEPSRCTHDAVLGNEQIAADNKLQQSLRDINSLFLLRTKGIDTSLITEEEASILKPDSFLLWNKQFIPSSVSMALEHYLQQHTYEMSQTEQVELLSEEIQETTDKTCGLLDALLPHYEHCKELFSRPRPEDQRP